ncbi:Putative SWI/SNF-related matrix-associated actin-dependent regulator of chromatin subfamily A member 3-like 1 [Dendrobium catenatum]|uniref:SWI/SNF-related matrix-associated actin-dependent regulator of chromatin subfamily A member 3-like 1 n=1 Tax=Dendrobium catenatum TaxID=906689 RepID=A0A2I0WIE9_9ASPA|nr:Putative SWI/SNF-related matrix-associated actin-dependent regulator of chromatin subfamily A member 3-like 1 [Dendrobium catenatum]
MLEEDDLWKQFLEQYDGGDGDVLSVPSQVFSDSYLIVFVIANIVGLRYYSGTINGRELVGLVREPLNPYDPNAMKVLNSSAVQVGHIERTVAAVLLLSSTRASSLSWRPSFPSPRLVAEEGKGIELLEPPKDVILTKLFPHQKEGLGWLVHRENSQDLPLFWKEKNGAFLNVLTNHLTNDRQSRSRVESLLMTWDWVYLYHGERKKEVDLLLCHDIVLTTYKTLALEFRSSHSPLKEIEWLRVILDEAHVIKNFLSQQTKAVVELKAERRWVVTGTPIQNNSFDLYSLMAFLRFLLFSIKNYWQRLVQRPLDQGSASGIERLQALMESISLRRMKGTHNGSNSLVGLPSRTVETCFVELFSEEPEQYEKMESEARSTLREYINADTILRNYSTVLHIILRLRQICNNVALCPSDLKSLITSNSFEDPRSKFPYHHIEIMPKKCLEGLCPTQEHLVPMLPTRDLMVEKIKAGRVSVIEERISWAGRTYSREPSGSVQVGSGGMDQIREARLGGNDSL